MTERMWIGRKVQIWSNDYKKLIGIAVYKGSTKFMRSKKWVKIFQFTTGKRNEEFITELDNYQWNPLEK